MSTELDRQLLRKLIGDEGLIAKIDSYLDIIKARKALLKEIDDLRTYSAKAIQTKEEEMRALQKTCNHPLTVFHPDASGNNDSETECKVCGLYWHGKKEKP